MLNEDLDRCLKTLATNVGHGQYLLSHAAYSRCAEWDWIDCRGVMFTPVNAESSSWEMDGGSIPVNSNVLYMPIHVPMTTKGSYHYVCVVRFGARGENNNGKVWCFTFLDSRDPQQHYFERVKNVLRKRTTLGLPEDKMDGLPSESEFDEASSFEHIPCANQIETECGFRVVLHIYLAMFCHNIDEFRSKIQQLDNVQDLRTKTRKFVMDILDNKWTGDIPEWIGDEFTLVNV